MGSCLASFAICFRCQVRGCGNWDTLWSSGRLGTLSLLDFLALLSSIKISGSEARRIEERGDRGNDPLSELHEEREDWVEVCFR